MSELISVFMLFILKIEFKSFSIWCCILGFDYLLIFYCMLVYKNIHRMLIFIYNLYINHPTLCPILFLMFQEQFVCVVLLDGGWLTGLTIYTLGGNSLSLSQQLTIAKSYMAKGGILCTPPLSIAEI